MAGLTDAFEARSAVLRALGDKVSDAVAEPAELAAALAEAADKAAGIAAEHDDRPTARAWRAYAAALRVAARLVEWKNAVRQAEPDADRFRNAARLIAGEARTPLDADEPLLRQLTAVLEAIVGVTSPAEIDTYLEQLRAIPLPLPLARPPDAPLRPPGTSEEEAKPPAPIAVALFSLGDEPAPDATVIRTNRFTRVGLQLRLTEWPEWAEQLVARAISIAGDNAGFPPITFTRPAERDEDGLWSVDGESTLVIKAAQPLGEPPLTFTLSLELTSSADGRTQAARSIAGQRELQLWANDDSPGSYFTGYEQLDARVAKILAQIHNNAAFGNDAERKAFTRFLRGLLRATTGMQRHAYYRDNTPGEAQFQKDLLMFLEQQPELQGRVQQGAEIGGGETDLVHDGIVDELKVVKDVAVTEENASRFLGQTTSYASGLGSQLGIAVILDLSPKTSPLGHPANYVHFLEPKLHGVADPAYASHVAVLVVNGNAPLPSGFAGKKIETLSPTSEV